MRKKAPLAVAAAYALTALFISAEEQYTVSPGDSLSKIGRQFGIPYRDIMAANQLETHRINVGQVLIIPDKVPKPAIAPPVFEEVTAIYPTYDRYRSPAITDSPIAPVDPLIQPTRVGIDSGEAPLIPAPKPESKPEAFAKPIYTYPSPTIQKRYSAPTLPGETGPVSPYNDGSQVASQTESYTKPSPPAVKKTSSTSKRGRTVPAAAKIGRYMVQPGDSVRSISKKHGITFWQLRSANSLGLKKIYPGQMLKIPGRSR